MSSPFPILHSPFRRRGLTLVEVVVATMITGVMTVAALNSLGAATSSSMDASRRATAVTLATELMTEILYQTYLDADGTVAFGPETGESTSNRADFDDVDDYDNWSANPPQEQDGADIPDRDKWERKVLVNHVDPTNVTSNLADNDDRGAKGVIVDVYYDGVKLLRMSAVTTRAWPVD